MASYTTHYNIKKPTFFESADVLDVNANMDILDTTVYNVQNSIAPDFSSSSTYEVDDLVIYNSLLYRCTTAVITAGAWNSANWTREYAVNTGGGGGSGSSLPDYSTTEQNTGQKWVDGSDIYQCTFVKSSSDFSDNTITISLASLNPNVIVNANGMFTSGTGVNEFTAPIPYVEPLNLSGSSINLFYLNQSKDLCIRRSSSSLDVSSIFTTVWYTKTIS